MVAWTSVDDLKKSDQELIVFWHMAQAAFDGGAGLAAKAAVAAPLFKSSKAKNP